MKTGRIGRGPQLRRARRLKFPESRDRRIRPPEYLAGKLMVYDVISFDVFDTLLLRPFSEPADLFYMLGIRFAYPGFRDLRVRAEAEARAKDRKRGGNGEIGLSDIWEILAKWTGIPKEQGMGAEQETEEQFCLANPYFERLVELLRRKGKTLVAASDMYLDGAFLGRLLEEKGLGRFEHYFVSSDYRESKAAGGLYRVMREKLGPGRMAHVGDNIRSDILMAGNAGFTPFWHPNPQTEGNQYRSFDLSAVVGSMYRGIVNIKLHAGNRLYPPFYEYGYVYGGMMVLGFCRFIHDYVAARKIEAVWFLTRDGEIVKKVYDRLYPGEKTALVRWSRRAAARLLAEIYPADFFERFLFQKTEQGYSLEKIFRSMGLRKLLPGACEALSCGEDQELTRELAYRCRDYLLSVWEEVTGTFREEREAAGEYLAGIAGECRSAAAVDVGWAGSGAVALGAMTEKILHLPCRVYALLAGTVTDSNADPDVSEGFFFAGQMESYFFSQQKNRDLWRFHDLRKKHNLWMELLFTSDSPTLRGFSRDGSGLPSFRFGRKEAHHSEIRQIQQGILDYTEDWMTYFGQFWKQEMGQISGRDAYAPFRLFLRDRRAQRRLESSFCWDTDQNVE